MKKKIYLQLLLIFILVSISLILFFKYFSQTKPKANFKPNIEQNISANESLIEDLKYLSTDKEGNEYKIEAKKGNIDKNNPDIIFLEDVNAIILLENSDFISIESKFGLNN